MRIGVIGSGTMGNGIAHTFASNGYQVLLHDIKEEFLEKGVSTIQKNLNCFLDKGKITKEDINLTLDNISTTTSLENMKDRELIIEAATENFDIKASIFNQLDQITSDGCILASNTSSISIITTSSIMPSGEKTSGFVASARSSSCSLLTLSLIRVS